MATIATVLETVFPKAAGAAQYTWRAHMPDGSIMESTDDEVALDTTGRFSDPQEARDDAQAWLLERITRDELVPREVLILRAQPEVWGVLHVG